MGLHNGRKEERSRTQGLERAFNVSIKRMPVCIFNKCMICKLGQWGPTNQIINNSDFKQSKLDRRLRYKSDSKSTIELMILILM